MNDLNIQANRIIMNLPETAYKFLPLAIEHLKSGGIINYYQFSSDYSQPIKMIKSIAKPRKVEILDQRKVKSRSPGVWHMAIDARIS